MSSITPKAFKDWASLTGTSIRVAAEQAGISKSVLGRWANASGKLSRPQLLALQALCRGRPAAAPGGDVIAEPGEVRSQGDMQRIAREATADCFALWRSVVVDPSANMAARLKAADALMAYGWGNPPKLQAERRVEAPTTDAELLDKLRRLSGAKPA